MAVKINISISEELLQKMDEFCKKFDYERSEFVREAIRKRLYANPQATPPKTEIPPLEKSDSENVLGTQEAVQGKLPPKMGYCYSKAIPWHERGKMFELVDIKYENLNGDTVYAGEACPGCVEVYRRNAKKEGVLYVEGERQ